MRISIELFLLDNLMMNLLMLRLAYVLAGVKPFPWRMWLASSLGAVYALLSMTVAPVLSAFIPKLLLGAAMALPLLEAPRQYPKALLCLYVSACLMGGVMLGLAMLFGGSFRGGAFVCTVPVRLALLAGCCCALLPQVVMRMLRAIARRPLKVRLVMRFSDRTLELTALVDTGNLLVEPISGLPVIVVRPGLLPPCEGRPVPYRTVNGQGILRAVKPDEIRVFQGYWHNVNAMAAESAYGLKSADAIVGGEILTEKRWCMYAQAKQAEAGDGADLHTADSGARWGSDVHPLGGDAAAALCGSGRTGVDQTADE